MGAFAVNVAWLGLDLFVVCVLFSFFVDRSLVLDRGQSGRNSRPSHVRNC